MKTTRTRPIRGKYFLTIPRVAIHGVVYEIKVKISQVIVTDLGPARKSHNIREEDVEPMTAGEIERGSVDGDED